MTRNSASSAVDRGEAQDRATPAIPQAGGVTATNNHTNLPPREGGASAPRPTTEATCDVVVIGGGVAGLTVALSLPPSLRVAVLTKAALGESNTRYAQGGLAAPVGLDDDPELQVRDTIVAGAGLVDETAARAMLGEAREAVAWLIAQGAQFDERAPAHESATAPTHTPTAASPTHYSSGASGANHTTADHSANHTNHTNDARRATLPLPVGEGQPTPAEHGQGAVSVGEGQPTLAGSGQGEVSFYELATRYDLTLEAAHSRRRVLHAQGDATGAEIERALVAAVRARPGVVIYERTLALDLVMAAGACVGVDALLPATDELPGAMTRLRATRGVVLANGGAGRLWLRTSNPPGATADGIALALRAGATLADLEFAQFHPTVLAIPDDHGEAFLISEAVRGEGAYLRNQAGERFMPRYHPDAELAPRDVVARAALSEMLAGGVNSVYLDLRHLPADEVRHRFPSITDACRQHGLDLARDLIPVAPAAHYFMGGVAVDTWARTSVPQLYAVGEVACTGVHGANRLASNSLLEGLVFARRLARAFSDGSADQTLPPSLNSPSPSWGKGPGVTSLPLPQAGEGQAQARRAAARVGAALPGEWVALDAIAVPAAQPGAQIAQAIRQRIQRIMWERVSLRRDAAGLVAALADLHTLADDTTPLDPETANMLLVAQAITTAALARVESRGGHYRSDHPDSDPARDGSHTLLLHQPTVTLGASVSEEVAHAHV